MCFLHLLASWKDLHWFPDFNGLNHPGFSKQIILKTPHNTVKAFMSVRKRGQEGPLARLSPAKIVCFLVCVPWKILPSHGKKSEDTHEGMFTNEFSSLNFNLITYLKDLHWFPEKEMN
jgi:hypothetical protein